MKRITIDVVSDVVCPWCYLGKARLDLAIAEVQDEIGVEVNWRPYQLDPDATAEGADYRAHLIAKFGSAEKLDQSQNTLRGLGNEVGVNFRFEDIKVRSNTLDAHRLIHWAGVESREIQEMVTSLLFKAHFEEGRNIAEHPVLVEIATTAGMDGAVVTTLLSSDADRAHVTDEIDAARKMGVNGVPFFIIDQRYAVSGAQPADSFADALRQIAAEKDQEQRNLN